MKRREMAPAILLVVVFILGAIWSPHFLDARYLLDEFSLYAETGLLALGMTLVIVSGQIDLSVASTLALVACVVAKLLAGGCSTIEAFGVGLALGGVLGLVNGWLVSQFGLPSFVVTLATMAGYRGAAQAMMGAQSVRLPERLVGIDYVHVPHTPIPATLVLFLVFASAVGLLLHRTVFGRWIYSVGTNERAAFYSGVPTKAVTIWIFALSGVLAAVGGLIIDSRLGVARYDSGRGMEVDAITAVVLGGASIYGGRGSVLGTVLAVFLVALLRTAMWLANFSAETQLVAVGVVLVGSVILSSGRLRLRKFAESG
jgi:rhamnose transport system permease protein